jgi:hypothetical protein
MTPGDTTALPNTLRGSTREALGGNRPESDPALYVELALTAPSETFEADRLTTCSERFVVEKHCSAAFVALNMTPGDKAVLPNERGRVLGVTRREIVSETVLTYAALHVDRALRTLSARFLVDGLRACAERFEGGHCSAAFVVLSTPPGDKDARTSLDSSRGVRGRIRHETGPAMYAELALRTLTERFVADGLRTCSERFEVEKHCSATVVVLNTPPGDTAAQTPLDSSRGVRGRNRHEPGTALYAELALRTLSERFAADGPRTCSERFEAGKHCSAASVVLNTPPGDTAALPSKGRGSS